MQVVLTKHHGLGNDFLVLDTSQIGRENSAAMQKIDWSEIARQWCDRTLGIGADGLLLMSRVADFKLRMQLFNQDGSRAEMSGNGIRCLAQAAFDADGHETAVSYTVTTDEGDRVVDVEPVSQDEVRASVDMGPIKKIDEPKNRSDIGSDPNRPVMHISVGNPHAVVGVEDVSAVDCWKSVARFRKLILKSWNLVLRVTPSPCAYTSVVQASPRPAARALVPARGRRASGAWCRRRCEKCSFINQAEMQPFG